MNVNQSATIKALTVNNDVYMASGYMSQGVNATNASITNANITNAYLTNLNVSNLQQMPCYIAGYVIGKNGTGFHPILCTVVNTILIITWTLIQLLVIWV